MTRQQETFYNKLVSKVLQLCSDRIIAFDRKDQFDSDAWSKHLYKIFKYMKGMEENKHLEPSFSNDFNKLVLYLKKRD